MPGFLLGSIRLAPWLFSKHSVRIGSAAECKTGGHCAIAFSATLAKVRGGGGGLWFKGGSSGRRLRGSSLERTGTAGAGVFFEVYRMPRLIECRSQVVLMRSVAETWFVSNSCIFCRQFFQEINVWVEGVVVPSR